MATLTVTITTPASLTVALVTPLLRSHLDEPASVAKQVLSVRQILELCAKDLPFRLGARAHDELRLNDENGHEVGRYHFEIS